MAEWTDNVCTVRSTSGGGWPVLHAAGGRVRERGRSELLLRHRCVQRAAIGVEWHHAIRADCQCLCRPADCPRPGVQPARLRRGRSTATVAPTIAAYAAAIAACHPPDEDDRLHLQRAADGWLGLRLLSRTGLPVCRRSRLKPSLCDAPVLPTRRSNHGTVLRLSRTSRRHGYLHTVVG